MNPIGIILNLPLLLISVSIHEFAHGWTAYKRGDNTAKEAGRLTLNPISHIDPIGTIILPLLLFITTQGRFVFGAAKPVPVNFNNLKNPKQDIIWVGASGPLANFMFAVCLSLIYRSLSHIPFISILCWQLITINIILGVFNLIPIPPLDGSRIVMGLLPRHLSYKYALIEPYGFFIIMAFIFLGLFDSMVEPVVRIILSWLIMKQ